MSKNRNRFTPRAESIGRRLVPSAAANTILIVAGDVSAPRARSEIRVEIAPKDLVAGRPTTIFGLTVQADGGTNLAPRIVSATGPSGKLLRLRQAGGSSDAAATTAFFKDDQPGPVSVRVEGRNRTTGTFAASVAIVGDVNGDGIVNLADEAAFAPAYLTRVGDGFYLPSADANANGFVGQGDALALEHNLNPPTRPIPLSVTISLAPEDRPRGHIHQKNSGGFTYQSTVTIVGRTTPGSMIFSDSPTADYSFTGPIQHADAHGQFAFRQRLTDKLTNTEFLIVDPFGHRLIRAFPIRRLGS